MNSYTQQIEAAAAYIARRGSLDTLEMRIMRELDNRSRNVLTSFMGEDANEVIAAANRGDFLAILWMTTYGSDPARVQEGIYLKTDSIAKYVQLVIESDGSSQGELYKLAKALNKDEEEDGFLRFYAEARRRVEDLLIRDTNAELNHIREGEEGERALLNWLRDLSEDQIFDLKTTAGLTVGPFQYYWNSVDCPDRWSFFLERGGRLLEWEIHGSFIRQ